MSDIEFNPKLASSEATRESESERDAKDVQKAQQKAAAFQQALHRSATNATPAGAAAAAHAGPQATLAAIKQGNTAAAPGVKTPEGAAVLSAEANALAAKGGAATSSATGGAGGAGVAGGSALMQTLAAKLPAAASGEGGTPSTTQNLLSGASGSSSDPSIAAPHSTAGSAAPLAAAQASHNQTGSNPQGDGSHERHPSSLAERHRESAAGEASTKEKSSARGDALTPRIDLASIIPSFPMPAALPGAPVPSAAPQRAVFNADLIQQIVEYALVTQNAQGQSEFHLGLTGARLAGVGVHLTACGKRRVRVRFTGVADSDVITEGDVSSLVELLRAKNVEVADVIME